MNTKTIDDIRKLRPCYDPARYLPEDWTGTALDILKVTECPPQDRLWVVLRNGWIDDNIMHEFAYLCAERVLPIYEKEYPGDDHPRKAIEAKRAWLRGEITDNELDAASDAARAASDAAWAAARAAAWAAASDAARDAARDAQIAMLIELLGG